MFNKKTIEDIDLGGKTVLVRADYNVPLKDSTVADSFRIEKSLPTLNYLLAQNCKIIICSHLGRPDGEVDPKFSLAPVATKLQELLGREVLFVPDTIGDRAKQAAKLLKDGNIVLLENLRFNKEEARNDEQFAKELASLADIFVQDGFGVVHRAHSSTDAITHYLPSVAGLLLKLEVSHIRRAIEAPEQPLTAIIGGSKIEGKIELLDRFIKKADHIVIGGAMANTFLVAMGYEVGSSVYDESEVATAKEVMEHASLANTELLLPIFDVAVGESFDETANRQELDTDRVAGKELILDFGQKSVVQVKELLQNSGTIIWNGPLGVIELPEFEKSTREIAEFIANNGLNCIVGGGDSASYIHKLGLVDKFTHVSTGGGASLELMAGKKLPGIEALLPLN